MHVVQNGVRSMKLIFELNWERLAFPAAIGAGLLIGTAIGGALVQQFGPAMP